MSLSGQPSAQLKLAASCHRSLKDEDDAVAYTSGDDDDDGSNDDGDILGMSAAAATTSVECATEEAACCCLFPVAARQCQPPFAQSLSSLATGSTTSSRSSACEVAASTEWLHQQDAPAGTEDAAAADADAETADASAKHLDKLRSSLHSLRLGSRRSPPGPHPVSSGAKSSSAIWLHEAPRHHLHHQHPMSRGGMSSRRRSSAISAKSKAQYIAQYKAAKVSYFRSVIGGNAPVKERPSGAGVDLDAWR